MPGCKFKFLTFREECEMYKRDAVLALESGVLSIYMYYSNMQINLNICLQNGTIETLDISEKLANVMNKISVMRGILFKLAEIKSDKIIDYTEVSRRLYYLGSMSRREKLHINDKVWNQILTIIEHSSFSAVFGHFISKLRKTETKFNRFKFVHNKVPLTDIDINKIEKDLLQLGSYIQEFISYVEAVKIMLDYIEKEQIFEQASHDKNFIKPQRIKPVLQIVKGSKL